MNQIADIGQVYAEALFELAKESELIDAVGDDLSGLARVVADQKEFLEVNTSPYFSQDQKLQLLHKLFAGRVAELTMNFLKVVDKHNRMPHLPLVAQEYAKLRDAYLGCRLVDVTLAKHLGEAEIKKLADEIAAALKSEVKVGVKVDPSIIGGIIIRRGDMIVDNTVRRELREAVKAIINRQKNQEKIHEV